MTEIRRFLIALAYFTRIPIPAWVGWSPAELNRAARYLPLVGLLVGLLSAGWFYLCLQFLPLRPALLLSMISSLLLTGAFHEDGLADSADGFGGGWEKGRILEIMKDSRIGTYGAASLIMALLLKFFSLEALGGFALLALPIAHASSRTAPLLIMAFMRYVREDDSAKAKPVAEGLGPAEWLTGLVLGLLPLGLLISLGWLPLQAALTLIGTTVLGGGLWALYLQRRIGGYTGDALGACQQICELAAYLALCASLS